MENRKSYILKIIDKISGQVFICNRNDDSFGNTLYKDKYIRWFGFESYDLMQFDYDNSLVQVLKTIDVSNYKRGDQKYLNECKQQFIDEFDATNEDYLLCNKQLATHCMNIRVITQNKYNERVSKLNRMSNYEIWTKLKQIWECRNRGYYVHKLNYEIEDMNLTDDGKTVLMFYNTYLLNRIKNGCKYLVDKDKFKIFYKNILKYANTI